MDFNKVAYKGGSNGFILNIGDKPLKTPAKNLLLSPSKKLAENIVSEWSNLDGKLDYQHLPLTSMLSAIIDRGNDDLEKWKNDIRSFSESDLLCYFSPHPKELREQQELSWMPWISWANTKLATEFKTGYGIMPIIQEEATISSVAKAIDMLSPYELFTLRALESLFGSFILGYAVLKQELIAEEAFNLSQIDEIWQEKQWGRDEENARRREKMQKEAIILETFLKLL